MVRTLYPPKWTTAGRASKPMHRPSCANHRLLTGLFGAGGSLLNNTSIGTLIDCIRSVSSLYQTKLLQFIIWILDLTSNLNGMADIIFDFHLNHGGERDLKRPSTAVFSQVPPRRG